MYCLLNCIQTVLFHLRLPGPRERPILYSALLYSALLYSALLYSTLLYYAETCRCYANYAVLSSRRRASRTPSGPWPRCGPPGSSGQNITHQISSKNPLDKRQTFDNYRWKVKFRWNTPLKVRWRMPLKIHEDFWGSTFCKGGCSGNRVEWFIWR